ncbi:hypothetical protein EH223_06750 [candidate division KSB1 bacterium]|nr:tetratricopeptide repeat protein [candidate division KSB1 bacterium]RQW04757.1 MAG: hypothetical protein EH223_06750 [candidate division KSB1 bacterium]
MNSIQQSDPLEYVWQLMAEHDYLQAEKILSNMVEEGQHEPALIYALARCQLARENHSEALYHYSHLLQHANETELKFIAEAALILDKPQQAMPLFEAARQQDQHDAETSFLLALTSYKLGFIKQSLDQLQDALRAGMTWEDEDACDFVVQQVLPVREFHDFEMLFLDAVEIVAEKKTHPQNRWFSINMPIFELFSANTADRQKQRAGHLALLLSSHFGDLFLSNGRNELWKILDDLSNIELNPEFGKQAREALKQNNYSLIAQLILALELEHLKQFAASFGLSAELIKNIDLQHLIPLLPLRLAVALMFLYSAGNPDDKMPNYQNKLEPNTLAALLAACFISYYQQVDKYKSTTK